MATGKHHLNIAKQVSIVDERLDGIYSFLHGALFRVHHPTEEKGTTCGTGESGRDEFIAVRQRRVTIGTGEDPLSAQMLKENSSHHEAI